MSVNIFKAFCELWCHTADTFCTESSDMSISLRDMWVISGLPADRSYYENLVPPARELLTARQENKQLKTCTFLFSAFHRVCQDVNGIFQLTTPEWIRFWFCGPQFYTTPPQRDNMKRVKALALTSCPSGTIVPRSLRTKREKDPFSTLNIPFRWWRKHILSP